jgi:hypothetical protein
MIDKIMPNMNLPLIGSMMGRVTQEKQNPDMQLMNKVAEMKLDEEKDTENALMTLLDWLGRPQAAVAGVLTDLVDGGDFSPFDRIGQTLLGEERHRMKDFLDEIAPGKWTNVRLPDWMGGSEFDLLKEGVGFMADIFTDPLMAINTFTTIGNVGRHAGRMRKFHGGKFKGSTASVFGGFEANRVNKILSNNPKMAKEFNKTMDKAMESLSVAERVSTGMVNTHIRLRELYRLHEKLINDPYGFASQMKTLEQRTELLDYVAPYIKKGEDPRTLARAGRGAKMKRGSDMEDPLTLLHPDFTTRVNRGEATFIAARIPWLMRIVGIPDGQFSLIPKMADEWASAMVKGLDAMTQGMTFNTAAGRSVVNFTKKMLMWGTGTQQGNAALSMAATMNKHFITDEQIKMISNEASDIFRKLSPEDTDIVMDMLRHPYEFSATKAGFLNPRQVPDRLKEPVEKIRKWFDWMHHRQDMTPGQKVKYFGKDKLTNKEAHTYFYNMLKRDGADLSDYPTWKELRAISRKEAEARAKKHKWDVHNQHGDFIGRQQTAIEKKLLRAEFEKRQHLLKTLVPDPELAYVPRFMTETAEGVLGLKSFRELLKAGKLKYKDKNALDILKETGLERHLLDYDVPTLNRMAREGVLPYDYLEKIFYYARKNLAGKDKKLWDNVLGGMDARQLSLFMDDPVSLIQKYMVDTNNALNLQDKVNLGLKIFAREVSEESWNPMLGERLVLFSKEGMRARYGDNWEDVLGPAAVAMHKALIEKSQLQSPGGLSRVFHTINEVELDVPKARAAGLPVHAMPSEVMEGFERFVQMSQNPTFQSKFMRGVMKITNLWKATSLAFFPAYYARNYMNGFWQAGLGDSLSIPNYNHALKTLLGSEKRGLYKFMNKGAKVQGDSLSVQITDMGYNGRPLTREDAYRLMLEQNVLQQGIHKADQLHITDGELVTLSKTVSHKLNKSLNKATNWLFERGNEAESVHRAAHFIDRLRKGDDPYQAAQSVKKYFYNFSEVSAFDKNMMPLFPFWNWTRKNTPAMFEFLVTKPGAFAQANRIVELFQSDDARDLDPKLMPKWVTKNLGVPSKYNKKTGEIEVRLWNQWMGWTDLRNWVSGEPHKLAADMLSPMLKLPIEMATNHDFYTEEDIERFSGEPYGAPFLGMDLTKMQVKGLKTFRAANELNKLIQGKNLSGEKSLAQRFAQAAGVIPKSYKFDYETLVTQREFEISKAARAEKRSLDTIKKRFPEKGLKIEQKYKKQLRDIGLA